VLSLDKFNDFLEENNLQMQDGENCSQTCSECLVTVISGPLFLKLKEEEAKTVEYVCMQCGHKNLTTEEVWLKIPYGGFIREVDS